MHGVGTHAKTAGQSTQHAEEVVSESQTVDATGAAENSGNAQQAGPKVKQPIGLFATLSSIEMWERFSFYGLQVILAYYIYYSAGDGGLGLTEDRGAGGCRCLRWCRLPRPTRRSMVR